MKVLAQKQTAFRGLWFLQAQYPMCSGFFISPYHVMTAYHCVKEFVFLHFLDSHRVWNDEFDK